MFLRIVGYDGPYIDWQEQGNPIRRVSVLTTDSANEVKTQEPS